MHLLYYMLSLSCIFRTGWTGQPRPLGFSVTPKDPIVTVGSKAVIFNCVYSSLEGNPSIRWEVILESDKSNIQDVKDVEGFVQFDETVVMITEKPITENLIGEIRCIVDEKKMSHSFFILADKDQKIEPNLPVKYIELTTTITTTRHYRTTKPHTTMKPNSAVNDFKMTRVFYLSTIILVLFYC
ncbi:hypothetical protein SNEBB_005235 [Seison nebaliae]|nr:hypothetical protein SNEBB_005235 [Seison nebaliae]